MGVFLPVLLFMEKYMLKDTFFNDTSRWAVVLNERFQTFDSERTAYSVYSQLYGDNLMLSDEQPLRCEVIPPGRQSLYPLDNQNGGGLLKMSELSEFDLSSLFRIRDRQTQIRFKPLTLLSTSTRGPLRSFLCKWSSK
jgi:hypothetical protein